MSQDSKSKEYYKRALEKAQDLGHAELRMEHVLLAALDDEAGRNFLESFLNADITDVYTGLKGALEKAQPAKGDHVEAEQSAEAGKAGFVTDILTVAQSFCWDYAVEELNAPAIFTAALHELSENRDYYVHYAEDLVPLLEKIYADSGAKETKDLEEKLGTFLRDNGFLPSGARLKSDGADDEPLDADAGNEGKEGFNQNEQKKNMSDNEGGQSKKRSKTMAKKTAATPTLDKFSTDLTQLARDGELESVIGRESELEQIAMILTQKKKNNAAVIGEAGVGKTAILEGFALKVANGEVPRKLQDKRIVALDTGALMAGTKYRGELEERIQKIVKELGETDNVVLAIDEMHTLTGVGDKNSVNLIDQLKPLMARGKISLIGATTLDEYRQSIEKDKALDRRFQKVMADEPSVDETFEIMNRIKWLYEGHHNITISEDTIHEAVRLSAQYVKDIRRPDSVITVIDRAGSKVNMEHFVEPENIKELREEVKALEEEKVKFVKEQKFENAAKVRERQSTLQEKLEEAELDWHVSLEDSKIPLTVEDIAEVIAKMTNIPVSKMTGDEATRYLKMEEELTDKIVGQDEAVQKIAETVRNARAGFADPNKPLGSFVFLGSTGVGKTHVAKKLAEFMFGDEDALVRIDMSEYQEKFNVSRLVGAPPGYVGYEEAGQLTEKIRRRPYSVILLDEIEKAHPDVFDVLLQVLDDGHMTDGQGRKVDFKNTVIIMTSNIGANRLQRMAAGNNKKTSGFAVPKKEEAAGEMDKKETQRIVDEEMKKAGMRPEFLNRIDETIVFNALKENDMHKILDIELKSGIGKRIEEKGLKYEFTDAAKDFLLENGTDVKNGARPLKRAIKKYVVNTLSKYALAHQEMGDGDKLIIDHEKGAPDLSVAFKKKGEWDDSSPKAKANDNAGETKKKPRAKTRKKPGFESPGS